MGEFSLIHLDSRGKLLKSEAVSDLTSAINSINESVDALKQIKGIGSEYLINQLIEVIDNLNTYKTNVNNLR